VIFLVRFSIQRKMNTHRWKKAFCLYQKVLGENDGRHRG